MGDVAVPIWAISLAAGVVLAALAYGFFAFNRVERTMVDKL